MPFVSRDEAGAITLVATVAQEDGQEFLPDDDKEVVEFLERVERQRNTPSFATRLGLKRAFDEMGKWTAVKAMIASNEALQEEWDLATEIRRSDPLVQNMIAAMKLTDRDVDALLIRANELVA